MGNIEDFLQKQQQNNLLRSLNPADFRQDGKIYFNNKEYYDFSSNDYLGLSGHPKLKQAAITALEKYGVGSCASRLLSGDGNIFHQLEQAAAKFVNKPAGLIYNSGYQANLGIISALCRHNDVVFCDKLVHASIIDAIKLSQCKFYRFNHNDLDHLKLLLEKYRPRYKQAMLISETVFSMDGDLCPVPDLVMLKEKYKCLLMLDEAHAFGVMGECGSGLAEEFVLQDKVDIIMATFGKALGSFGAFLGCSQKIKEYLINTSRSFIYSTALPASIIAVNLAGLAILKEESCRRQELLNNAENFRKNLQAKNIKIIGESQIVPVIIGDSDQALQAAVKLRKKGFWVCAIRPPTVYSGQARLRLSLSYCHGRKILEALADELSNCL
jgi:8-amino-7-oxononanoate synthase